MSRLYVRPSDNRVIYLTRELQSYLSSLTDLGSVTCLYFNDPLPPNMNNLNCAEFRLVDGKFVQGLDTDPNSIQQVRLLQQQVGGLLELHLRVQSVRRPFAKRLVLQDRVYAMKVAEAERYIGDASSGPFELLEGGAVAHKVTLEQEALSIMQQYESSTATLVASEVARLVFQAEILAATDQTTLSATLTKLIATDLTTFKVPVAA